mgnify:CR=1 FL=1
MINGAKYQCIFYKYIYTRWLDVCRIYRYPDRILDGLIIHQKMKQKRPKNLGQKSHFVNFFFIQKEIRYKSNHQNAHTGNQIRSTKNEKRKAKNNHKIT